MLAPSLIAHLLAMKYVLGVPFNRFEQPCAREGLSLVNAIFAAHRELADLAPAQRKAQRNESVRPLVDAFFAWARTEHARLPNRGLVATALGYSVRCGFWGAKGMSRRRRRQAS